MSENEIEETEELEEDERLPKFKMDISRDADVMEEQRRLADEDMRFVDVPGGMWENFLTDDFDEERVKLEFDIVSNFLVRFLGEWDMNRVGVEFKPDDSKTSDDDAELLNGIYRADFRNFSGDIATDNAVREAATCGVGAMKLATFFEDDEDPENEAQRIEWRPIYNAYETVVWDQASQRIDKRDARWVTVLKPFTMDSFEETFPGESAVSAYTPGNVGFQNTSFETPDFVYVATRYEIVKRRETTFVYNNLKSGEVEVFPEEDHELIKDELAKDELRTFVRERKIIKRSVEKSVFSGETFLKEPRVIVGKWLPIVPFYAYRSYVDGVEWSRGLVRKLKDAARLFNMQVSQLAENAASGGQQVEIFLRDQMLNLDVQQNWADKNNVAYHIIDPAYDADGNVIAVGPVGKTTPSQLDGNTAALAQIVPAFIQDSTGGVPQETLNPDASGKAIQALIKRENLTTRLVTKNIADAIKWSGEIYQHMARPTYSDQRIISTIGKDGRDGTKQISETVVDQETGTLVQINTLKGKKFRAYADAGPQYETLREQTVEDLKGMLTALVNVPGGQQYTPAIIAVLLENITGVGMDPIKELNRRIMLEQGMVKPETPEEEALVAQLQEAQAQEDPNKALLEAVANKENAEGRNLDARSLVNLADAGKKEAETVKTQVQTVEIMENIDNASIELLLEQQKIAAEQDRTALESLPLGR